MNISHLFSKKILPSGRKTELYVLVVGSVEKFHTQGIIVKTKSNGTMVGTNHSPTDVTWHHHQQHQQQHNYQQDWHHHHHHRHHQQKEANHNSTTELTCDRRSPATPSRLPLPHPVHVIRLVEEERLSYNFEWDNTLLAADKISIECSPWRVGWAADGEGEVGRPGLEKSNSTTLFSSTRNNLFMWLKFQRPPAREDQYTQITEYEAKAVEILNFPRKSKEEAFHKLN